MFNVYNVLIFIFLTIAGDDDVEVVTGDTLVVDGKFLVLELNDEGNEDRLKLGLD